MIYRWGSLTGGRESLLLEVAKRQTVGAARELIALEFRLFV